MIFDANSVGFVSFQRDSAGVVELYTAVWPRHIVARFGVSVSYAVSGQGKDAL